MRRFFLVFFVFFQFIKFGFAQQYPYTSNFYSNPFFYNPAIIAEDERNEINIFFRKQWLGFNDAPTTQGFNIQLPLPKNVYLGVNFIHDRSVLLKSSSFEVGIGYKVQFDENNLLKFGISTGIGTNNFEFDLVEDYTDPAIYQAVTNKNHFTGRFGLLYKTGKLSLGASLPQIFKINHLDTAENRVLRMDQFGNFILSAKYRIDFLTANTSFEPILLYRKSELMPGFFEFGGVFGYKDLLSAGAFYKTNFGISVLFGINLNEKINFSYAYEHTTSKYFNSGNGNHELNFRLRFGGKKSNDNIKSNRSLLYARSRNSQTQPEVKPIADDVSKNESVENMVPEEISDQVIDYSGERNLVGIAEEDLDPDESYLHFVVIGAFKYKSNASKMVRKFANHDLDTREMFIPSSNLHYVFIFKTKNLPKAKKVLEDVKQKYGVADIWIYHEKI